MDDSLFTLGLLALFTFGGLSTYTLSERRHRPSWRRFARVPARPRPEPFRREAGDEPIYDTVQTQRRAPATIRRTALWSIYMGQMAVPGGLLGMFGLLAGGLGLVSIPGLILAVRIWRLGYAMLRGDAGAADEARTLSRFALILNGVAMVIAMLLIVLGGVELAPVSAVLVVYGAVSIAHAAAMKRCAELLEADALRHGASEV